MLNKITVSFLLAASLISDPAVAKTVFRDMFDNPGPVANKYKTDAWRFSGFPQEETLAGNRESERYDPRQTRSVDGNLQFSARVMTPTERDVWLKRVAESPSKPDVKRNLTLVNYVSGMATTFPRLPFGPGTRFIARFKIPNGAGLWPAVWAFDYASQTEVDLFEGSGRLENDPMGNFSQAIHDHRANFHVGCAKIALRTGWHVAVADWTDPSKIAFSYDGIPNCTRPVGPNMRKPMALIANLAVGSANWPWIGVPAQAKPVQATFSIDWWKVES